MLQRSAFGWKAFKGEVSNTNLGIVVHYDGSNTGLAKKPHSECMAYWVRVDRDHRAKGWNGVGYSYMVCPHGEIMEGRGYGYVQAAQKSEKGKKQNGNERYVSCTFASGPKESPTAAQIEAFRVLVTFLERKGMKRAVFVHNDFTSTECPGDNLEKLARSGKLLEDDQHAETVESLPVMDYRGSKYEAPVKALQKALGVDADAILGPVSWGALLLEGKEIS